MIQLCMFKRTENDKLVVSSIFEQYLIRLFNNQIDGLAFCRVMNGINAPKVVECFGSDGKTYRQLAKSGNDDLRQDAVLY